MPESGLTRQKELEDLLTFYWFEEARLAFRDADHPRYREELPGGEKEDQGHGGLF